MKVLSPPTVQVLARALDILEVLTISQAGLGISEISGITQLPVSTVHRLLKVLKKRGYASQNPETRKYHIQHRLVPPSPEEKGIESVSSGHAALGDGHYHN